MLNSRIIKIIKSNKSLDYKNLRLFRIVKVYENFVYKLKLSSSIRRLYLIFYS